jgi:hypothetical protein
MNPWNNPDEVERVYVPGVKRPWDDPSLAEKVGAQPGPMQHTRSSQQREKPPMSWSGAGENLAAGFENLTRGVRQVTGLGEQETDEQLRARRTRDERLADMPLGGLIQGVGESGPLALVPFGSLTGSALVGAAKVAGSALPRAAATAARESARKFATNPSMVSGKNIIGGAAGGAAGGALAPVTSDESRGRNAAVGAGVGGAAPVAIGAVKGGVKGVGGAAEALMDSPARARRRAVETVESALDEGRGLDKWARRDIVREEADKARKSASVSALPRSVSTAGATDSAAIAGLEKQSRGRTATKWRDKDQALDTESRDMLTRVLEPVANEKTTRLATREANRAREIADLNANTDPVDAQNALNAINQQIIALSKTGEGSVPDVMRVLKQARGMIARKGADISHLHNLRSYLSDVIPKAGQGGRQLTDLQKSIDAELNSATRGRWGNFLNQYGNDSNAVKESETAESIIRKFIGPQGERVGNITADAIDRAKAGANDDFGPMMTPPVTDDLRYLVEGLRQAESPRKVGASPGAPDDPAAMLRRGWHNPFNRAGLATLVDVLRGRTRKSTLRELDDMLIDPERFADVVYDQGKPLPKWLVDYMNQAGSQTPAQAGSAMERR